MKIEILPNVFLNEDGTFNKDKAIKEAGVIAGVCYDEEGYNHVKSETSDKTMRRVKMTLNNGHHSVYDHIYISFNMMGISKMLAMILNNEHEYTTSEKSARYTKVERKDDSIITRDEVVLYNKWKEIFKVQIKDEYGSIFSDSKIEKLAGENARYLVTVFMPTEMIYTTSLRQINYIASWMKEYMDEVDTEIFTTEYSMRLYDAMENFLTELDRLNILVPGLMSNDKHRHLSLLGSDISEREEYFGSVYSTNYKASLACLAQAQRHRTLDYQMEDDIGLEYYVPKIIRDDFDLVSMWLEDMHSVSDVTPQGTLVNINEMGKYDDFILKCKERLCSAAQLEIMEQTRETLLKYKEELEKSDHPLKEDIKYYMKGARCTFPDFHCTSDCKFTEGKKLVRKI